MNIHCIAEREIETIATKIKVPFAAIAISSPTGQPTTKRWERIPGCIDILSLVFDDINQEKLQVSGDLYYYGMLKEQADQVFDFVKKVKAQGINTIVCQCEAGISRSAGVAAALAFVFDGDCMDYVNSDYTGANIRVFGLVLRSFLREGWG